MLPYPLYGFTGLPSAALSNAVLNATATWFTWGFCLPAAKTLNKAKIYISAKTGSPLAAEMELGLYANSSGVPGSSITTKTLGADPTAATWLEWTGWTDSLSAHTQYWLIAKNLNATPASNNITFQRPASGSLLGTIYGSSTWGPVFKGTTDSGGAWATPSIAGGALLRLEFSDGSFYGAPIQSAAGSASGIGVYSGRKLGNYFTTPASYPLNVIGIGFPISKTGTPTVNPRYEIYSGTSLVATSQEIDRNSVTANAFHHAMLTSAYTLLPSTTYRVVIGEPTNADASGNRWNSLVYTVENDANSIALIPNGWRQTYYDGSSWAETSNVFLPMQLLLDPAGQFAAASGGFPMIGSPLIRGVR